MIKKWITESKLHTGIFCLAAIILSFAIYRITCTILTLCSVGNRLSECSGSLLASIVIVLLYKQIFDIHSFGMQKKNFLRGMITGILMLIIPIRNVLLTINQLSQFAEAKTPSLYLIIIIMIEQTVIGISEVFLFQGMILNILLEKMKHLQYKGMVYSLLISSLLSGSICLLNLLDQPELINTAISQAVVVFFFSVFLGAVYLRSNNIWVVVFYHSLINISGELPFIFFNVHLSTSSMDTPAASAILNTLANSFILFAGLFLARKSKSKYA